jgi:type VI secretion system protein VasD
MPEPTLSRRGFLAISAAGLLAACGGGPPGPATVTVAVTGQPGMNPGPDGADRPVTLSILRLRDAGAFNAADFVALQNDPAAALGGDLLGIEQLAVAPGATASKTVTMEPEATQLGLVAALRDPTGKFWRTATPIAPGSTVTANVTLGPSGITLAMA